MKSFRYLPRCRTLDALASVPATQLVNAPAFYGTQRCPFCHYYDPERTYFDYLACTNKNRCGRESMLWADLANHYTLQVEPGDHFTPTSIVRSSSFDLVTRYLQLVSCDIPGYECNQRCQFYPQRIASEQTIADCSNSHGCGRNGSYLDLLTLTETRLLQQHTWNQVSPADNTLFLLDGTIVEDITIVGYEVDAYGLVRVSTDAGGYYYVVNMISNSNAAVMVLKDFGGSVPTWQWVPLYNYEHISWADCTFFTSLGFYVVRALMGFGMVDVWIEDKATYFTDIYISSSLTVYFYYKYPSVDGRKQGNGYLVTFTDAATHREYYIEIGTGSGKYLMLANTLLRVSNAVARTPKTPNFNGLYKLTLTHWNSPLAAFLRAIGVRSSILNVYA